MLTVYVQNSPSAATLLCHGRIVLGVEAETLRCIANARPERHVVVDLQHVYGMDAAGLGLLVELHCRARQRARWLSIANPCMHVQRLLELTGLDSVLDVKGSREHFVAAERSAMTA
jgi:anti-anti-sigma factor